MTLQCAVLAGGRGTRMRPFTDTRPKALLPVLGRPFADWQLQHLAEQGVERIVYCIGHRGQLLREHIGDGRHFGLVVTWVSEGNELRGTAGALRLALDQSALDDVFFVLYGDSYLPAPMGEAAGAWRNSGMPALTTVFRNDGQWDRSNVIYAGGRITLYDKSRPPAQRAAMHWIDYGLSVLTRGVIADRVPPDTVADLGDVLRDLSLEGQLAGYEVRERFYEVGSEQGLRDLEEYLRSNIAPSPSAGGQGGLDSPSPSGEQ
jgi:MurNAc alpha-1-phosphate uridylyltransferase